MKRAEETTLEKVTKAPEDRLRAPLPPDEPVAPCVVLTALWVMPEGVDPSARVGRDDQMLFQRKHVSCVENSPTNDAPHSSVIEDSSTRLAAEGMSFLMML